MPKKKDADAEQVQDESVPSVPAQDLVVSLTTALEQAQKLGGEVGLYVEAKCRKALAKLAA